MQCNVYAFAIIEYRTALSLHIRGLRLRGSDRREARALPRGAIERVLHLHVAERGGVALRRGTSGQQNEGVGGGKADNEKATWENGDRERKL